MSNFPLLDILKGLATLATKSDFSWTSATGMDNIPVTAMLVQLEEGLLAFCRFFSELDPLGKRRRWGGGEDGYDKFLESSQNLMSVR